MMKKKSGFAKRSILFGVLIFMGMNVFGYLYWGKTVFNLNQNSYRSYLGDNSTSLKQHYKIDGYIITQEESIYDHNTGLGYCCLSFKKKNGRMEGTVFAHKLISEGLGEGGRFDIIVRASKAITYERNGNKIFAYIKYTKDITSDENAIKLRDYGHITKDSDVDEFGDECSGYIQDFTPDIIADTFEYKVDKDIKIYVSPLGCSIHSNQKLKDIELKVLFKNKNTYAFNEKTGEHTVGSGERDHGSVSVGSRYQRNYVFEKPVKVSDIKGVEFNQKKIF
ncbi:hypothetical protein SAMN02910358_01102 [Lachnospiraceae bacterium XBB1006]|nr:hypothetical protein SAMN02910358_01102 [Lachnospiraceae bacterium XBB1006]